MAKHKVKRIGVIRASVVSAVLLFFISLIMIIPMGLIMSAVGAATELPGFAFSGIFFIVFAPFLYAIFGFIFTALCCALYNWIVTWAGPVEIELDLAEDNNEK